MFDDRELGKGVMSPLFLLQIHLLACLFHLFGHIELLIEVNYCFYSILFLFYL